MGKFVFLFFVLLILCTFAYGQYEDEEEGEPENEENEEGPTMIKIGETTKCSKENMNSNVEKCEKNVREYHELKKTCSLSVLKSSFDRIIIVRTVIVHSYIKFGNKCASKCMQSVTSDYF